MKKLYSVLVILLMVSSCSSMKNRSLTDERSPYGDLRAENYNWR